MQNHKKIILDHNQQEIVKIFDNIVLSIELQRLKLTNNNITKLFDGVKNLFYSNEPDNKLSPNVQSYDNALSINGIYLYGGVGCGKTMLMQIFYDKISLIKKIIHFQKFMQDVHARLHKLRSNSDCQESQIIQILAHDISQETQLICMDEFEIKDITDAMLIMQLFEYLSKNNVFIFLTTNTAPPDLYKDGLQRQSFIPFIDMVQEKFQILNLNTTTDYRYKVNVTENEKILYPTSNNTQNQLDVIKKQLCGKQKVIASAIEVFGRNIHFASSCNNILFTDFNELFERDLGYNDYVNLCQKFTIILVEGVRVIAENETDIITRFINFIDNAYFYKILLFVEMESAPEKIYPKGKRIEEFTRTISRLHEMNSKDYEK